MEPTLLLQACYSNSRFSWWDLFLYAFTSYNVSLLKRYRLVPKPLSKIVSFINTLIQIILTLSSISDTVPSGTQVHTHTHKAPKLSQKVWQLPHNYKGPYLSSEGRVRMTLSFQCKEAREGRCISLKEKKKMGGGGFVTMSGWESGCVCVCVKFWLLKGQTNNKNIYQTNQWKTQSNKPLTNQRKAPPFGFLHSFLLVTAPATANCCLHYTGKLPQWGNQKTKQGNRGWKLV